MNSLTRIMFVMGIVATFPLTCWSTAQARGEVPPPPPFSGGNAGDWLGSGPVFGFDGPINGGELGGGPGGGWWEGGSGCSGSSGGREYGGSGGGTGGSNGGGAYSNDCYRAAIVTGGPAPCIEVCHCTIYWYADNKPKFGTIVTGVCEIVQIGQATSSQCQQVQDACSDIMRW